MAQGFKNLKHKQLVKGQVLSESYYNPSRAEKYSHKDEAFGARDDAAGDKGTKDARREVAKKYGVHPSKLVHVGVKLKPEYEDLPVAHHSFRIK